MLIKSIKDDYSKPINQAKKSAFTNYEQRNYNFDNELNLQEIKKATEGVDTYVQMFTNIIEITFFYIPYIVVILIYLFKLNCTLIYIILFLTISEIIFQYLKISCFKNLSDNQGAFTREIEYYSEFMICQVREKYV